MPPEVGAAFESYAPAVRDELLDLRRLILQTAEETDGVGALTETLKWGQPAYLTSETASGSTIRIAATHPDSAHDYAMFFICNTGLVDTFRTQFGKAFSYEKNRALLFRTGDGRNDDELRECVAMALTYHLPT